MTMNPPEQHPKDERLAAFAGADQTVMTEAALRDHVEACPRCASTVSELRALRSVLGELPDLVPSRPLRLVPPVEARPASRAGGWMRRLFAPTLLAGLALTVIGGVGSVAPLLPFGVSTALRAPEHFGAAGQPEPAAATAQPGAGGGAAAAPGASASSAEDTSSTPDRDATGQFFRGVGSEDAGRSLMPWAALLGLGLLLIVGALLLRYVIQPRAA
jgi:hypothetical protein